MPFPLAPVPGAEYQDGTKIWRYTNGGWKVSPARGIQPPVAPIVLATSGTLPFSASGSTVVIAAALAITVTLPDPAASPGFTARIVNRCAFPATLVALAADFYFGLRKLTGSAVVPAGATVTVVATDTNRFVCVVDGSRNAVSGAFSRITAGLGTFIVPDGVFSLDYIVTGGGGGGAGCDPNNPTANAYLSGSGGGSGGTVIVRGFPVTPGASFAYQVGAAGLGGPTTAPATSGGLTYFNGDVGSGGGGAIWMLPQVCDPGYSGTVVNTNGGLGLIGGFGGSGQSFISGFGMGGASYWGGGTAAYDGGPTNGQSAPGSGGGGSFRSVSTGSPGMSGCLFVTW